jgi:hypothetical protein
VLGQAGTFQPQVDQRLVDLVDPLADRLDLLRGGFGAGAGLLVHQVCAHVVLLGCWRPGRPGPGSIKPRAREPGA